MVLITRYNSFIWGIIFASVTWTVSLYLYSSLSRVSSPSRWSSLQTSTSPPVLASTFCRPKQEPLKPPDLPYRDHKFLDNDIVLPFGTKAKTAYYTKKKYSKNSGALIKQLQSVSVKSGKKISNGLEELGMIKTLEDQKLRDEGYKKHAFNTLVSQRLGYHRQIPDTRNALCAKEQYPSHLPTASVVICFYNEDFHTLMRTIYSVLDRTPKELLHEVLVVNDNSDIVGLHYLLWRYINQELPSKVILLKTLRREGLVRSRMFGAKESSGQVLVFLDSHVEVNVNWLQPLLARIAKSRKNVAMPIIDIINADTFEYSASPLVHGGFNRENLPTDLLTTQEDVIKPIRSPTMAGGLFAIDRSYFEELSEYDPGTNMWGGENLEMSFKISTWGGTLELIPCSRVGHVFRRKRPYGSSRGEGTMTHNSLRGTHVVRLDKHKTKTSKKRYH